LIAKKKEVIAEGSSNMEASSRFQAQKRGHINEEEEEEEDANMDDSIAMPQSDEQQFEEKQIMEFNELSRQEKERGNREAIKAIPPEGSNEDDQGYLEKELLQKLVEMNAKQEKERKDKEEAQKNDVLAKSIVDGWKRETEEKKKTRTSIGNASSINGNR